MNVLILNPAVRRATECGNERYLLGSGIRFPWSILKRPDERPRFSIFPMFLGYAAAVLERAGIDVKVIDAVPINLAGDELERRTVEAAPDLIVFEPNSSVVTDLEEIATRLKALTGARIAFVGVHATAECFAVMAECDAVDFCVIGEFDHAVTDLARDLAAGGDGAGVPGVARRDASGGFVRAEGRGRAVDDLDALPVPARHLFPAWFEPELGAYFDGFNQFRPCFDVHATRGCPYRCNFCAWVHVLYRDEPQRTRSPAAVVDEMEMLVARHGAREVYFDDDNFSANRKWVESLCAEIIRRGNPVRWSALTDAIALNDGMLERMAEAGCIGIKFGLDSADSEVLRTTNKPLKVSRVQPLIEKARVLGIKTHMTVVLGLSGETKESLERTFGFACEQDIDSIQLSVATPIPGTPLYEGLKADGKLHLKRWDDLDGYSTSVMEYEDFSREYLEAFVARAHTRWLRARLRDPRWVARQVRYLARVGAGQGVPGLVTRVRRLYRLVAGDTSAVGYAGRRKTFRY